MDPDDYFTYEEWKEALVEEFVTQTDMTIDQAREYVNINNDWEEYYDMGLTPDEVVSDHMGFWQDM